jgi:threonine dehydrogenase-like Zn-dependent dehydrogenase
VTVDAHERRRQASLAAGADVALPVDAHLVDRVREVTGGRGADIAVEASGSPAALQGCIDAAAFGGTVVVASWYGTRDATLALGGAFHRRRLRIVSSQVSTLDAALAPRWDRGRRTALVTELIQELPLAPLVTHRFPFREAAAAYRLLDRAPEECLQVVLNYV